MNRVLEHRGPDEEGYYLADRVGLAMRRLSIIDLQTGQQPLKNETGTVVVVFNGEIYNYRELRSELEQGGHIFATRADGEVIPHLWEELGPGFAERLNGMFAIALYDLEAKKLVLVRDRVGIKPLFWTWQNERLTFGSEIKAIIASGELPATLDFDGLGQFLAWEYVPAPRTLFKGVQKLEPGHAVTLDLARATLSSSRWWSLDRLSTGNRQAANRAGHSAGEEEERLDSLIQQAVKRQLVSDVPLGSFLSGGVDSSLVAAGMGEARAFTIGFDDPTYDESRWATAVARHLGLSHRLETIRPEAARWFDRLLYHLDDPIGDFSIFPTFLVSRLAREEVKVVLSGDGGDELFGGYETYAAQEIARRLGALPDPFVYGFLPAIGAWIAPRPIKKGLVNKAKRFLEGLQFPQTLAHARWRLFLGPHQLARLLTPEALQRIEVPLTEHIDRLRQEAANLPAADRDLYVDFRSYLPDNCLVKVDRMSMAVSLEVRVPLLDNEIIDRAFSLPSSAKVHGRHTKVLLKQVASRHLPAECVHRPKEGFSMPMKDWLRGELQTRMQELLAADSLRRQGIFDPQEVERLQTQHLASRANHSHVLWGLMVFQDWYRRWEPAT